MINTTLKLSLISTLIGVSLMAGSASAASKCKGLENAACKSNSVCGWVNGYERKDGRKVTGFCRSTSRSGNKSTNKSGNKSGNKASSKSKPGDTARLDLSSDFSHAFAFNSVD